MWPVDGMPGLRRRCKPTIRPPTPVLHVRPAGAVIDGKFYVAGGADASNILTHQLDCYDPVSNTWTQRADLPTARWHCAGAVANGKFYVIGGDDAAGSALNAV